MPALEMRLRAVFGLAVFGLVLGLGQQEASAHGALVASDPPAGSMLESGPTTVRLTFTEPPEVSLSSIRVVAGDGSVVHTGSPQPAPGDPLGLEVRLQPVARGVLTATWRTVSAVDGHPTAGVFNFGVGVIPGAAPEAAPATTSPPWSELVGRVLLIAGLVGLLGAACAAAAGYGPVSGGALAVGGWVACMLGLGFLADGQRRNAGGALGDVWATSPGRALLWRAVAIGAAGAGLAMAQWGPPVARRAGPWVAAGAAGVAMVVDVAAGHAAGAHSPRWATIGAQGAHFVAAGVWLGGLATLLIGTRGRPSEAKAATVRRFSRLALVALGIVIVTGVVRAVGEVSSWSDLLATGYGRALTVKVVLIVAIIGLAATNRRRSVPTAGTNLRPLRRLSSAEITLAAGALAAAAVLTSLAPPAAPNADKRAQLTASAADFATSVRVTLRTQTASPGPNVFRVRVADYDTGEPVAAERVSLRFRALDDPGMAPTVLALRSDEPETWAGSGGNLAFDGRWEVTAVVEQGTDSVAVRLALDVRGPPQFLSVERLPGQPVRYTTELAAGGYVRLWADPQRPGHSTIHAEFFIPSAFDFRPIDQLVLTTTVDEGPIRQHVGRPIGPGQFVADVELSRDGTTVAVVARARDGARLRAAVHLDAPG